MNTRPKILPAVCCIALLSACASNKAVSLTPKENTGAATWSVAPMSARTSNDKPESLYQIGRYYQGQNRYDMALAAYQKALAADDGFVEARNGMGVVYSRQGKYREAIAAFRAAIQQAPKAAHIYSNLGYAYYLQGQYAESVAALEQATTLDPANQRALNNLGLAYAKIGNQGESMQAFSQATTVSSAVSSALPSEAVTVPNAQDTQAMVSSSVTNVPVTASNTAAKPAQDVYQPDIKTPITKPARINPDAEMLALPKDRGVIRPASTSTFSVVESRVKLVEVSPNTYEIRERSFKAKPLPAEILHIAEMPAVMPAIADTQSINKARLEVSNGNGVTGMAGKVGQFLKNQGYQAVRLTNQKPFQVRMTQIQYREGYQAQAQLLKISLPESSSPTLVQRNDLRADIGVRLVLGKDVAARVASFDSKWNKFQFALNLS